MGRAPRPGRSLTQPAAPTPAPPGPTFLVIGAAKSATSSLYEYFRAHRDVYMSPVKETNFFALGGHPARFAGPGDDVGINAASVWLQADYGALFAPAAGRGAAAAGEVSPLYLYSLEAARRAAAARPGLKAIAILRHPADRAYAAWGHKRRDGVEPLDFAAALAEEPTRRAAQWEFIWHYEAVGHYANQLRRWQDALGVANVRVVLYEDLDRDAGAVMRQLFEFVGVDPAVPIDTARRYNPSGEVRSAALQRTLTQGRLTRAVTRRVLPAAARDAIHFRLGAANLRKPAMPPAVRAALVQRFSSDVDALEPMLNRDLSAWRV